MELGERLKQSRTNKGFSQTNVADHLNISRQSISKWENGNSLPDLANLVKLSNYYEVSIDELLKENKQLKNKIEANELEIEDKSQKLNFIRGISQNDEGLVLLGLSFLSFLISPLGLLISPILMIRNKKTNTLYRLIYIACICCMAYNLFIGYGILSDIFGWGTTTVEYLG